MWEWALSKYLIVLCSLFLWWWDDIMPTWWEKWGKRCRHCDITLGYYKGFLNTRKHWDSVTVNLITQMITKWIMGRVTSTLDKGMTHVLPRMEQEGRRFHHATQNGARFKTYGLFLPEIFQLIFLNHGWLQVAEITETEIMDEGTSVVGFWKLHFVWIPGRE